ncbi:glycosyltransferase [Candidatus Pelagibacter bacterium]|jgi:rhamnosyltransferase|nr:glycosyltransferase [Candidatus Pelagibacter bacterium]MDA8831850.1 glycosyltransferase [Candidatus Pelagibacter bacterium]MDA9796319.1 glycosyltransferase [Candidatus Pelagibacter ubique]
MVKKLSNFTVVIRVKNEERWIGYAIQSVLDYLIKPEIVIVNNNSNDKTIDIVKFFAENPNLNNEANNYSKIKIINIANYSPGRALNLGVKNASKKYIMILSAHCILKKFNEANIIKDLEKNSCVFGNQIPVWNGKKISKRYLWSHFSNKKTKNMYSELEKRYFLHNALAVYKKNTLKKFPFDENLTSKEDRYWANKIIKKKMNFIYDPELIAEHQYTIHGNTWKGIA